MSSLFLISLSKLWRNGSFMWNVLDMITMIPFSWSLYHLVFVDSFNFFPSRFVRLIPCYTMMYAYASASYMSSGL